MGKVVEETANITEEQEVVEETSKEETPLSFDEILEDKLYQSEFDKRVSKAIETSKAKLLQDIEAQKNEAEKLAKMKEDERVKYEKDQVQKELNELKIQLNAKNLKDEATKIANEKGLPTSYLELVDFTKETAESINEKVQTLVDARSKDLEGYLNTKLKQTPPSTVKDDGKAIDPYIAGFMKTWETNK
jgi:hypothetical protein